MGLVGLLCLVCLRRLQPEPGVCLLAGVVAIFLKIFTLGGFYPGPIIGIGVQALAVEIAMTGAGGRAIGAAIGGFVALGHKPAAEARDDVGGDRDRRRQVVPSTARGKRRGGGPRVSTRRSSSPRW